jgi:hypothetical protein
VAGEDVDLHWQGSNFVVELDSREFHRARRAFGREEIVAATTRSAL